MYKSFILLICFCRYINH